MALPAEDRGVFEADDADSLLGDADDFVEFNPRSTQDGGDIVDDDLEGEQDNAGSIAEPEI